MATAPQALLVTINFRSALVSTSNASCVRSLVYFRQIKKFEQISDRQPCRARSHAQHFLHDEKTVLYLGPGFLLCA
jgi:hypothetical protein